MPLNYETDPRLAAVAEAYAEARAMCHALLDMYLDATCGVEVEEVEPDEMH